MENLNINYKKNKYIKIAAIAAAIGNAILAVLNIVSGIIYNSSALIGVGIDASIDVLISIIVLVIVKIMFKPADAEHPWGHGRAENIATAVLSFIIFFAGAQLIISSVSSIIFDDEQIVPSGNAIIISIISIVGKSLLAWCQHTLGKRADSAMIKANAKNMASDILITVGVLVGLVISNITNSAYADSAIAVVIGILIVRTAIGIFFEANTELMDGNNDMEAYGVVLDAVKSVEGALKPHKARMRRIAGFWDIDLDIEVNPKLTVLEAHNIAKQVEYEIKQRLENVFDIMIHVEPLGGSDDEAFGLSEHEMKSE